MAVCPMDQFLCWKLKIATLATAIYVIVTAGIAAFLELLDIIAQADDSFDISGGFKASWRAHVWEGWLACNIVMFIVHMYMIIWSAIIIVAIKRYPTYYEYILMKFYLAWIIMYVIIEMGTSCYKYSWYGPNIFRRPFLVFSFIFWLLRLILNVTGGIVVYSRIAEVDYEIQYGERKMMARMSGANDFLLPGPGKSGRATPAGLRTPNF